MNDSLNILEFLYDYSYNKTIFSIFAEILYDYSYKSAPAHYNSTPHDSRHMHMHTSHPYIRMHASYELVTSIHHTHTSHAHVTRTRHTHNVTPRVIRTRHTHTSHAHAHVTSTRHIHTSHAHVTCTCTRTDSPIHRSPFVQELRFIPNEDFPL